MANQQRRSHIEPIGAEHRVLTPPRRRAFLCLIAVPYLNWLYWEPANASPFSKGIVDSLFPFLTFIVYRTYTANLIRVYFPGKPQHLVFIGSRRFSLLVGFCLTVGVVEFTAYARARPRYEPDVLGRLVLTLFLIGLAQSFGICISQHPLSRSQTSSTLLRRIKHYLDYVWKRVKGAASFTIAVVLSWILWLSYASTIAVVSSSTPSRGQNLLRGTVTLFVWLGMLALIGGARARSGVRGGQLHEELGGFRSLKDTVWSAGWIVQGPAVGIGIAYVAGMAHYMWAGTEFKFIYDGVNEWVLTGGFAGAVIGLVAALCMMRFGSGGGKVDNAPPSSRWETLPIPESKWSGLAGTVGLVYVEALGWVPVFVIIYIIFGADVYGAIIYSTYVSLGFYTAGLFAQLINKRQLLATMNWPRPKPASDVKSSDVKLPASKVPRNRAPELVDLQKADTRGGEGERCVKTNVIRNARPRRSADSADAWRKHCPHWQLSRL